MKHNLEITVTRQTNLSYHPELEQKTWTFKTEPLSIEAPKSLNGFDNEYIYCVEVVDRYTYEDESDKKVPLKMDVKLNRSRPLMAVENPEVH